jgi:citrate synthase
VLIGRRGPAKTAIATADATAVTVRGRDLVGDVMGRLSFSAYFYLLVTGREPTEEQRHFLDLLLVTIAEHGLTPSAVAARMTFAAAPDSVQGAVAAGLLGAGPVILGSAEPSAAVIIEIRRRMAARATRDAAARALATEIHARGERMPGFGHPLHKPVDPRAERIMVLAEQRKIAGEGVAIARALAPVVADVWGRPLPMNVSMAIAAVAIDLDLPAAMVKAIPILARTAGLLAHIAEEQERPIGFLMASAAEEAIDYDGGDA